MKKSTSKQPTKASKYFDIKSFSYFIPAPPQRKVGYREKEFDKILFELLNKGHEIIQIKTAPIDQKGTLVICIVGSTNKKATGLHLDLETTLESESEIELIYD